MEFLKGIKMKRLEIEIPRWDGRIRTRVKIVFSKRGGFYSWITLYKLVLYFAFEVHLPTIMENFYKRKLDFSFWIW